MGKLRDTGGGSSIPSVIHHYPTTIPPVPMQTLVTIDVRPNDPSYCSIKFESWEAVARHFNVNSETIRKDKNALGIDSLEPTDEDIQWIRLMRAWVRPSGGRTGRTRPNFIRLRGEGKLAQTLVNKGIIQNERELPRIPD